MYLWHISSSVSSEVKPTIWGGMGMVFSPPSQPRTLSRTLSGLFLVGALNRPRKRKRTNRENPRTIPEQIGKIPEKSGKSQKGPKKDNWPVFRQISGRNFLPELCGEIHPGTALLQALRCALCSTEQSTLREGENDENMPRKGEEEGWPAKGAKRKKGRVKTQFYGHLEKMRSFCRKNHVRKIPPF